MLEHYKSFLIQIDQLSLLRDEALHNRNLLEDLIRRKQNEEDNYNRAYRISKEYENQLSTAKIEFSSHQQNNYKKEGLELQRRTSDLQIRYQHLI